jgi:hypothetical protein
MTASRAALISLMERYLAGLMEPFVTLLELHKLMYFLQEAGQDLKLRFRKAPYGPDAEASLGGDDKTRRHFGRVVELVQGFETPFGMELLATVHWVATRGVGGAPRGFG